MRKPDPQSPQKGVATLVKETLIAMAKDNVQGTPANYKRYYESIAGAKAPEDTGSMVLQKLLEKLGLQGSPLITVWENAVDAALNKKDPRGLEELILKSVRVAGAAKGESPDATSYKARTGSETPEDSCSLVLRELQNRLEAQGSPFVAEWENALDGVTAQKDGSALEALILKSVHTAHAVKTETPSQPDRPKVSAEERSFNNVLYVLESFARNLEILYPENPMLMGQIEIVKDLLEHPKDTGKMYSAKRALAKMAAPEKVQVQLGAAKASANNLADEFLAQIGKTGNDAGDFLKEIEAGKKAMEEAQDQAALLAASQALLTGTSAVHGKMKENQAKLEDSKIKAQKAAEKIRTLEEEVKVVGEKAKQDYLTGLLNRQGMNEEIAKLFGEGWEKVTLALLDIDNVTKLSDQLGQKAVDEAIKHLADAIRESVGAKGVAARMGDEEFVVIFSGYGDGQVKDEMEKLQRFLTRKIFMADQEKRVVTFSAGVAQRAAEEEPSETLARADEAMYLAKQKGKNRVEISELC